MLPKLAAFSPRMLLMCGLTAGSLAVGAGLMPTAVEVAVADELPNNGSTSSTGPRLLGPPEPEPAAGRPAGAGGDSATQLGQPTSTPPAELLQGVPPAPVPAGPAPARTEDVLPTGNTGQPEAPGPEPVNAGALLEQARGDYDRGHWQQVILATSTVLAEDPRNEPARQLRGRAYAAAGRFEEALADVSPVPVVAMESSTQVMSGEQVVATLARGTPIEISAVRGEWLKVHRISGRVVERGWIHRGQLAPRRVLSADDLAGRIPSQALPQPVPQPGFVPSSPGGLRIDIDLPGRSTVWRGRRSSHSQFGLHLDLGRGYSRHRRGHHYGRDHYDWMRHVPRGVRRYLPR